jgi:signal transduction histidine kinase
MLTGADPATVFRLIAQESLKLMDAAATLVAVPGDSERPSAEVDELVILEVAGAPENRAASIKTAAVPVAGTVIGEVFRDRTPRRLDHLDLGVAGLGAPGPALVLPLRVTGAVAGVLVALRRADGQLFTDQQLDMMAAFADQAALAWQLATSQRRMRELDVMTDRDRIARDLHDHVIQRLFAVGLALQGTVPRARSPEVQQRLAGCIDDLQETHRGDPHRDFRPALRALQHDPVATTVGRGHRAVLQS